MGMMNGLVPKVYPLLVECVERGISHGLRRALEQGVRVSGKLYAVDNNETRERLAEEILNAICESFTIEQDGEDELA